MVKLLHTADWHLGKKLYQLDRLPEQIRFLDWLLATLIREKTHFLLISGDIFDSAIPSLTVQEVFYSFLHRVVTQTQCHVLIIAGNHDSPTLIQATAPLLALNRLHLRGTLPATLEETGLLLKHPELSSSCYFALLPFFRSHQLRNAATHWNLHLNENSLENSTLSILSQFFRYHQNRSGDYARKKFTPCFFLGHHLFGDTAFTGTELPLSLAGATHIPVKDYFSHFHYGALGHIHQSIKVQGTSNFYYSGPPISMRFSENENKFVHQIKVSEEGTEVERLPIPLFRRLLSFEVDAEQTSVLEITKSLDEELQKTQVTDSYFPTALQILVPRHLYQTNAKELIQAWSESHHFFLANVQSYGHEDSSPNWGDEDRQETPSPSDLIENFLKYKFKQKTNETNYQEIKKTLSELIKLAKDQKTDGNFQFEKWH